MRIPKGKRYVADDAQLSRYVRTLKTRPCPRCGRVGLLILHGFLRGYSETGQALVVRGRRFFCSDRCRRRGCGGTFSVVFSDVLEGCTVRASTLWRYLTIVLAGLNRRAAWGYVANSFSAESGYRVWNRLRISQPRIRALLCRAKPPPESSSPEPLAQLREHLRIVFPSGGCPFSDFQERFQVPLLSPA